MQGQTIAISVVSPAGLSLSQVMLIGEDPIGPSSIATSVPAQFSISIPSGITCRPYYLTALGATSSGQGEESPTILLDVERSDLPTSLSVPLSSIALAAQGEDFPAQILGTFSDGSVLDVTESSYVSYVSSNSVVAYVNATGMITAVSPGSASVTATYIPAGQAVAQASIQVTVVPFLLTSSPSSLAFGGQSLATVGVRALTLTNSSSVPMSVVSINTGGDFSETDNCVSQSPLAAGASCSVTMSFAPTLIGPESGVISVETNLQSAATAVSVSGIGAP
jgi:hypothetical protein